MGYVYILQNDKGNYYIGSTTNVERRLRQHQEGHTPSTKRMRGLKLVFSQKFDILEEARCIECKLKKLKRHDYIEKIVNDGFIRTVKK